MQITLLPPLLPSEGVTTVARAVPAFAVGARIQATVLGDTPGGGTLLSLGGHDVPTGGTLPYPPGTSLSLEVVEGGAQPLLRLVSAQTAPVAGATAPTVAAAPGPPISAVTYGLAAAVLAARSEPDVRGAAVALARWLPTLVSSGVVTASQGDALMKALAPVPVPSPPASTPEAARATASVAAAIAERVAEGGLMLERRLADVVLHPGPQARAAATADVRSRLSALAHVLELAPPPLEGARDAVRGLQDALLAEQARTAAHLARDGVVDVRVPLSVQGHEAEMRLRMRIEREAPDRTAEEDATPWRQVRLDLAFDGLGRIQVRLGVMPARVRAEFFVEDAGAADRVEAGLAELSGALEQAGFAQVLSRVIVDPVRVCAPDDLPDLPPHRAILDARA